MHTLPLPAELHPSPELLHFLGRGVQAGVSQHQEVHTGAEDDLPFTDYSFQESKS